MENHAQFLLSVTLTLACLIYTEGFSMSDVNRLRKDILANYSKTVLPKLNQSDTMNISVGFDLLNIEDLDEVNQRIAATVMLSMFWIDEGINWNPTNYNGIDSFVTESGDFWTPNLILSNTFKKFNRLREDWHLVRYFPNGSAVQFLGSVLFSGCAVDVTFYPWDTQQCSFPFSTWGYFPNEIKCKSIADKVTLQYFTPNGAWDLTDSNIFTIGTGIIFKLTLRRIPKFVTVNIIVPIMFMSFLNIVVFAIPTESGERISYSLTVLLSIAVFLTLIGDNLPKTSNPISIFCYYLLSILIISMCVTLAIIFSIHIYFRDHETHISPLLASFGRRLYCQGKTRQIRRQNLERDSKYVGLDADDQSPCAAYSYKSFEPPFMVNKILDRKQSKNAYLSNNDTDSDGITIEKSGCTALSDHQADFNNFYQRFKETDRTRNERKNISTESTDNEISVSWKDLSVAMDKVFFFLFACSLVSDTILFWLVMTQRI